MCLAAVQSVSQLCRCVLWSARCTAPRPGFGLLHSQVLQARPHAARILLAGDGGIAAFASVISVLNSCAQVLARCARVCGGWLLVGHHRTILFGWFTVQSVYILVAETARWRNGCF